MPSIFFCLLFLQELVLNKVFLVFAQGPVSATFLSAEERRAFENQ
jgi:hypothetical protein